MAVQKRLHISSEWSAAALSIKQLIASLEKIAFAVYEQASDQIFWIKRDFHNQPRPSFLAILLEHREHSHSSPQTMDAAFNSHRNALVNY